MDQQKAFLDEWYAQNFPLDNNAHNLSQLHNMVFEFEEAVKKTLQVEEVCIVIPDIVTKTLSYTTYGMSIPMLDDGGSIVLECFYTQIGHFISHARRNALYRQKIDNPKNIHVEYIAVLPLIDNGETIAILRIATTQEKRNFTMDDMGVVETFLAKLTQIVLAVSSQDADEATMPPQKSKDLLSDLSSEYLLSTQKTNITVLVIDHSIIILKLLQNFLYDFDAKVLVTTSGVEGVELFATNQIDLVFIDETIGGNSGHETIKKIRAIEQKNRSRPVPIIGLTTDDTNETKDRMIRSGATKVLFKPIFRNTIHAVIRKYTNIDTTL